MKTSLLVLTKHFPFNLGETAAESYLEGEIAYLAEAFDQVVVVATEAPSNRPLVQELPANVHGLALGNVQSRGEKALCLLDGMFDGSKIGTQRGEALSSESGLSVKKAAFQRYFVGKACRKWSHIKTLLAAEGFTPTHVYSFWFFDTALVAVWAQEAYRCAQAVARAHRYDLYEDRNRLGYLPCRTFLLQHLDAVLPCSKDGVATLVREHPTYVDKIHRSYLGTRDLPDKSDELRGDPFEVVTCSRVVPVKRLTLVCDAMALLDERRLGIHWTHYGDGPELEGLKKRAAAFKKVMVTFPGRVSNDELLRSYGSTHIDLFINASSSEGLPISIMEASGHGIPVLATDVGGTSELVHDGCNGRLLHKDVTANELAAAVVEFYDMPSETLEGYRREARRTWRDSFRTKDNVRILTGALLDGA